MSAYANQLNRNESDFRHLHINTSDKETLKRLDETSYSNSLPLFSTLISEMFFSSNCRKNLEYCKKNSTTSNVFKKSTTIQLLLSSHHFKCRILHTRGENCGTEVPLAHMWRAAQSPLKVRNTSSLHSEFRILARMCAASRE